MFNYHRTCAWRADLLRFPSETATVQLCGNCTACACVTLTSSLLDMTMHKVKQIDFTYPDLERPTTVNYNGALLSLIAPIPGYTDHGRATDHGVFLICVTVLRYK